MVARLLLFAFTCCYFQFAFSQLPSVEQGQIIRFSNVSSHGITPRNVDVWLPDNYSTQQKYAVLYMHDGQMLFDSTTTWNKQAWEVDRCAQRVQSNGSTLPFIVVGIWNDPTTRHKDYFPQKPFEQLAPAEKDTVTAQLQRSGRTTVAFQPQSDRYLKFLVETVKPMIDSSFSVFSDQSHTFVAGSSMGGLISMYALCEYPTIFGGAACLSTHWPGTFTLSNNPMPAAFMHYLNQQLPSLKTHLLYFDCGDQTLDALYPETQQKVNALVSQRKFAKKHFQSLYFPGDDHSENAWKNRLDRPFVFLLKTPLK